MKFRNKKKDVRMKKITKSSYLLFLASSLFLLSCGFEPIYGVNRNVQTGVETQLADVEIGNIPDREGQYLRNALIDRFYRGGRPLNPRYTLEISNLEERLLKLDITKTADATRGQLRMQARLVLRDRPGGKIVLDRNLRTITSYNILASEFATRVTEENARTNALDDLARQAELQLSLYFRR
jgi:LPS-assembly lipoprotein